MAKKFPGIIGKQPSTPQEEEVARSALAKAKKRKTKRKAKRDATTTAFQGGDDFRNY